MPHVLDVLNEECPYDMEPGEYWVLLRELWEKRRIATVEVTTQLYFDIESNQWYVIPTPQKFKP